MTAPRHLPLKLGTMTRLVQLTVRLSRDAAGSQG
jgi:hypothetical protein